MHVRLIQWRCPLFGQNTVPNLKSPLRPILTEHWLLALPAVQNTGLGGRCPKVVTHQDGLYERFQQDGPAQAASTPVSKPACVVCSSCCTTPTLHGCPESSWCCTFAWLSWKLLMLPFCTILPICNLYFRPTDMASHWHMANQRNNWKTTNRYFRYHKASSFGESGATYVHCE